MSRRTFKKTIQQPASLESDDETIARTIPSNESSTGARPIDAHGAPFASAHTWTHTPSDSLDTLAHTLRDAFTSLGRELVAIKPSASRVRFATQAMLSVALAVALAYALNLTNIWWAAISGFAVMQSKFTACAQRGVHRVLGAVAGPLIGEVPWVFVPLLGVIAGVSVYRALISDAGYAWVLGAVTLLMVTFEAHQLASAAATATFVLLRGGEVMVGTFACVAVSALFHAGVQQYRKSRGAATMPEAQAAATIRSRAGSRYAWACGSAVTCKQARRARAMWDVSLPSRF